jgi:hypothetical protein
MDRYLCTRRGSSVVVWDVVTVTELRTLPPVAPTDRDNGVAWSQDGSYLARTVTEEATGNSTVEVYTLPEVVLSERTTIRAPQGVIDLQWAPARYPQNAQMHPHTCIYPLALGVACVCCCWCW